MWSLAKNSPPARPWQPCSCRRPHTGRASPPARQLRGVGIGALSPPHPRSPPRPRSLSSTRCPATPLARAAHRTPAPQSNPPQTFAAPAAPHSPRQAAGDSESPGESVRKRSRGCVPRAAICAFAGPVTVLPAAAASRSLGLLESWLRPGAGADLDPSAAGFRFPALGPQVSLRFLIQSGRRRDFPPRGSQELRVLPGKTPDIERGAVPCSPSLGRVGHLLLLFLSSVGAAPELFSEWMEREVFCEAYHVYVRF